MTTNELVLSLMSGGSIITTLILRHLDRRKIRADAVSSETEMYDKLLGSVKKELELRDQTITQLRTREERSSEDIKRLRQQNRLCEENGLLLKAEIDWMRKMLGKQLGDFEKMGVFVLDDSHVVTLSLKSKLEKSSILDVQVYNDMESFVAAVFEKTPKVLLIDYYLKDGKTSETLIDKIKAKPEYDPHIIIMSKDDKEELKEHLNTKGISRFYLKEGLYQYDIVKYVLKYAETILG